MKNLITGLLLLSSVSSFANADNYSTMTSKVEQFLSNVEDFSNGDYNKMKSDANSKCGHFYVYQLDDGGKAMFVRRDSKGSKDGIYGGFGTQFSEDYNRKTMIGALENNYDNFDQVSKESKVTISEDERTLNVERVTPQENSTIVTKYEIKLSEDQSRVTSFKINQHRKILGLIRYSYKKADCRFE